MIDGGMRRPKKKEKASANQALKLLRTMYNRADNDWHIWKGVNPTKGIKLYTERPRKRYLRAKELPAFIKAVIMERNPDIRDFALPMGLSLAIMPAWKH